jgi:hypothetical protein
LSQLHRSFTAAFYPYLSSSSPTFPIKPNPVRLMPGSLEQIIRDGFALIGSGKVVESKGGGNETEELWTRKISAEELVYCVRD